MRRLRRQGERVRGRRGTTFGLPAAVLVVAAAIALPPVDRAAAATACVAGPPAVTSWTIPQTVNRRGAARRFWWPVAVDGNRILLVHQPTYQPDAPQAISMSLATAGSPHFAAIPRSTYPHFGVLQRWQMQWPWIVGLVDKQPLPGPVDWQLWAGNLQTGRGFVLDQSHNTKAARVRGTTRGFPTFALDGGRVVWTWISHSLKRGARVVNRLALAYLASQHRSFLPVPTSSLYSNPTMSGNRIVWERVTEYACTSQHCPNELIDLQSYDLGTRRLTTLSHSSLQSGSSFQPGLWGSKLVFMHGFDSASGGEVILVDLAHPRSGRHAQWWQGYSYVRLQAGDQLDLLERDGLASWSGGLADLTATRIAPVTTRFEGLLSGGHSLVRLAGRAGPYVLVRVTRRCLSPGR